MFASANPSSLRQQDCTATILAGGCLMMGIPMKRRVEISMALILWFSPMFCSASDLIQSKYATTDSVAFVIGILALGVVLGLLCYTVFLALSTKELMFTYFSVIMVLLVILQTFSTYDRFLFYLTYNRVTLVTHLLFMTFLLFFERLFSLVIHAPRLSRFNMVSFWVIAVYTLFFLLCKQLFPNQQKLHALLDFVRELFVFYTNGLFLYTIIRSIAWMRLEAVLLLIAFIPPAFTTSINALNIFPFMHQYERFVLFLMQYNQPIGLSLQAILFSLAVGNRYNRLRLEQQQAKQEQEELMATTEERTRFFVNMSHETRTPLTIILGLVRQIRQGTYGTNLKQVDPMLGSIERNSLVLLRQINHLLRMERIRITQVQKPLSVQSTVSLIIGEFQPIAQEKRLSLGEQSLLGKDAVGLLVGQEDFESLVMNLLSNAIKYTMPGGDILVRLSFGTQGALLLSVVDSGRGIDQKDQARIFEQFEVVGDGDVAMQTGLGLPLVKHIIEEYGGSVGLTSRAGEGSTFTLTFPSELLQPLPSEQEGTSLLAPLYLSEFSQLTMELPSSDEKAPVILLVEDNSDLRIYIQSVLQPTYQVLAADSAEKGLEYLKSEAVDLIISDIMMPTMDGHAFLREAKNLMKEDPIPLIFLTARDSTEEKIASLNEGAIRYLTKPFRPEMLLAIIASIFMHDRLLVGARIQRFRQGFNTLLDALEHPKTKPLSAGFEMLAACYNLSQREFEVLRLIAQGKSDKDIGTILGLSVKTVANHNRNIYAKCQVAGRYELLAKLYAKG